MPPNSTPNSSWGLESWVVFYQIFVVCFTYFFSLLVVTRKNTDFSLWPDVKEPCFLFHYLLFSYCLYVFWCEKSYVHVFCFRRLLCLFEVNIIRLCDCSEIKCFRKKLLIWSLHYLWANFLATEVILTNIHLGNEGFPVRVPLPWK